MEEPQGYYMHARRGGANATFVVLPCRNGWYEHFVDGDAALRRYSRYVSYETIDELQVWWFFEYDRVSFEPVELDEAQALVPCKWSPALL